VGSLARVGSFVRRVKTASGATAVQIVHKRGRTVLGVDHIGSAHDAEQLALLLETAKRRLHAGQQALEIDLSPPQPSDPGTPVVDATGSVILWKALCGLYDALGFAAVDDEAFRALVLGRIIEPTSKLDTVRVLDELGVGAPSRVTFMRCLKRVIARDYRSIIAEACYRHATRAGGLALVLYDVSTLYFEIPREDGLRKVGMSKERRVDPQVTLGLLTDADGFPLAVHLFEGNKAETKTLIPVLTEFAEQHPDTTDIIVVADAGMLSAANLLALEQAGFRFIVGLQDQQGALRPHRALRALRQRLRRRPDHRDQPRHGHRQGCAQPAGGLAVLVHPLPPRHPSDQRHDRSCRSRRRRQATAQA
jgi:Transposase DDE domain